MTYPGVVTVTAGQAPLGRALRWLMVVGALFAVTLFGGLSCADRPLVPGSMAGFGACPNVLLQASLPGALVAQAGGGAPRDGHGPGEAGASACLFVVVALFGLGLAGAVRRPLLADVAYWWARSRVSRVRPLTVVPMWAVVLRI